MSEPYSAFLRLSMSRADLARWLAAAPPDVSRWSDWRSIGGQWSLPGGGDLSDPDAPGLQTLISDCNAMLARHRDNRAALEFVLGSAEAENIRIAAYDRQGRHFVAGSLTYSESLYDILFFLALGRSAAEFLATDDAGLVVVHDYLWARTASGERSPRLGLRETDTPHSWGPTPPLPPPASSTNGSRRCWMDRTIRTSSRAISCRICGTDPAHQLLLKGT